MNDEWFLNFKACEIAADEYYKAMAYWLTTGYTKELGEKCHSLAMAYNNELDRLLVSLRAVKPEKLVEGKITRTLEHQTWLAQDMELGFQISTS